MKVSIWQQWTSNHSNDFEIVGIFSSGEEATAAAEKLREMFTRIAQSREDHLGSSPTDVERAYAQQYQISWDTTLDWLHPQLKPAEHVIHLDNHVFVASFRETWSGIQIVQPLMARFTSQILAKYEMQSDRMMIVVDATCTIPDDRHARWVFIMLNHYFTALHKQWADPIPPWRALTVPVPVTPSLQSYEDETYAGQVAFLEDDSGSKLVFTNLEFSRIGCGLPAFMAYLKANGCTDIEYGLYQRSEDEVFGEDG